MNEIDEYIRANRERYTRAALDDKLRAAGHDQMAIDAAWTRVSGTEDRVARGDSQPGAGTYLLIVVAALGYGAAILAAGATVAYGGAVTVLMLTYIVAMLAGLVYSVRRLLRAPSMGRGASAIGVAFAISIVIFIGLSGACFAALGPAINANGGLGL
jgi:hypothetical protein